MNGFLRLNWDTMMKNLAIFLQRNKIESNVNNLAENVDVLSFFLLTFENEDQSGKLQAYTSRLKPFKLLKFMFDMKRFISLTH